MNISLNTDDYLSEDQLAEFCGAAKNTLRKWRQSRKGPSFHKLGAAVLYAKTDVQAWVESQRRESGVDRKEIRKVGVQVQSLRPGISRFNGTTGHKRKQG